jgi:hypothetical protein
MNAADLMDKLLEIERTVGNDPPTRVRALVIAAEESVLLIQEEMIETLRENELLRQYADTFRRASLAALTETRISEKCWIH